jgi:hypothetical protein
MSTTLKVKRETLDWLHSLKRPGESLDSVLQRIRGDTDPTMVLQTLREQMRQDAEVKARELYLEKVKAYNLAHQEEADKARRTLGITSKKGTTTPATDSSKWKKRV